MLSVSSIGVLVIWSQGSRKYGYVGQGYVQVLLTGGARSSVLGVIVDPPLTGYRQRRLP